MQCSFCGGEVNLSVGRCTKCGRMIDETSGIRLTRDIHELAERYGIKDEEEIQAEEEALPHLLHVKKNRAAEEETTPEDTGIVHSQGPTLGRGDYERLLSADEDIREDEDRPSYEDIRAERERLRAEQPSAFDNIWGKAYKFIKEKSAAALDKLGVSGMGDRVKKRLRGSRAAETAKSVWSLTGERLVTLYNEKFPELKRVRRSTLKQRIFAGIAIFVLAAAAVVLFVSLASSIAPGIKGEWLITETGRGERLTWEFTGTGKVIVRTYTDGEPHVYRTGTYKKRRRNDHNMLTITYEDGTVTRLYYEVSRGTGTFTNVDSNRTAQYKRIRR